MTRTVYALALSVLAFTLTACGGGAEEAEEGSDLTSYPTRLVGEVELNDSTNPKIRQLTFTDLDGVKQKCFMFGTLHGSMTCQPVASNPTPAR